jgi:hypothetical protein
MLSMGNCGVILKAAKGECLQKGLENQNSTAKVDARGRNAPLLYTLFTRPNSELKGIFQIAH